MPREADIARLKLQARRAYTRFGAIAEGIDCGKHMLKEINPAASQSAQEYNEAMTELRRLDPSCPEFTPL